MRLQVQGPGLFCSRSHTSMHPLSVLLIIFSSSLIRPSMLLPVLTGHGAGGVVVFPYPTFLVLHDTNPTDSCPFAEVMVKS